MKKIVTIFLFVFVASFMKAQQIPADIRAVMDANKIKGVDVWTGIHVRYSVLPQNMDSVGKVTMMDRAHQIANIKLIHISTNGTVQLTCKGGTSFDIVKPIFSNLVTGLGPVTETYSIEVVENKVTE